MQTAKYKPKYEPMESYILTYEQLIVELWGANYGPKYSQIQPLDS